MKIQVTIKSIYGSDKIYPHCKKSHAFAKIAGTTTLTTRTLNQIKELGYKIDRITENTDLNRLFS